MMSDLGNGLKYATINARSMKDKLFQLRSELTNTKGHNVDHCSFEKLLNVRYLRESGRNATVYDKELNMHFEDISALAQVYEIETVDFFVSTSQRLRKAQEYIRRINYRYDWVQVKVNKTGKVLEILNREELKERWLKLKAAVRKDYKGDVVEYGLSGIDKQFDDPKGIDACIFQYFHFGLLFPCVPRKHKENWEHDRKVRFSDYENEIFEEKITHIQTEGNSRYYELTGKAYSGSRTMINNYNGSLYVHENEIFPENVEIKIEFERDDILNRWSFELLRYDKE